MNDSTGRSASDSALVDVYRHIEYPFTLVRGEGMFVEDSEGRRYIDLYGGHCVASVGHSRPELVEAIAEQGRKLLFYSNLAPVDIRPEAAAALVAFAANGHKKVFFCNSGAEANENALKIAVKATGRSKIVAFRGGFHGRTIMALGATDNSKWHQLYHDWLGETVHLEPNDASALGAIDERTAAVILEPIQSIGGVTRFEAPFLKQLRKACDDAGAMLIFDEVQTGVGRTGAPFVSGHCGVLPDMATLAKGLAGGFPIGCVLMTAEVAEQIQPGDIAATFGGGPLAMAAMRATLEIIERDRLMENARAIEQYVRERFGSWDKIVEVRGQGLLLGLVLHVEAKPIQRTLFDRGIIVGLNANPNLVHLLPPLTVGKNEIDSLYEALRELL